MTCRRVTALTALITALPLAAVGLAILAVTARNLALAHSTVVVPADVRWLVVTVLVCCLAGSLYLVGSSAYWAARSWASLLRFSKESFLTLGLSIVVLMTGFVLGVIVTALGGGFL